MKRFLPYLALIPIVVLALLPPIQLDVPFTDSKLWIWLVLLTAFAGCYTLFLKINPFVKAFAVLGFINCFFSAAPYISQFAYLELVLCIYLFIICTKIEDWNPVFNCLWVILIITTVLYTVQLCSRDNLLNFGLATEAVSRGFHTCYGSVGNPMQLKSYLIIICAILLQDKRIKVTQYSLEYITLGVIIIGAWYFFWHQVGINFMYARGPVWWHSFRLGFQHPIIGWGIGSYKELFHGLATGKWQYEGVWYSAHNFWAELFFEMGTLGLFTAAMYARSLWRGCFDRCYCIQDGATLLALLMVGFTLTVHFPDRQVQTVPLLMLFLAYLERNHRAKERQRGYHLVC